MQVQDADREVVIKISDLKKSFGDNHVLRGFNVDLYKGENLVVLGKSGSGKSVLIKCIIGLLQQDSGSIKVFGQNVEDMQQSELDKMRARIGFLFQSNALYDSMTIRENLEFPLRRHKLKNELDQKAVNNMVMDVLENVGLAHTVDMMPSELSGGMRKRIALARTLILNPDIILYDEPTTGLDPITAKEIIELMLVIQKKYKTSAIIISHDMYCVSRASNRVVMLIDGTSYLVGSIDEIKRSSDNRVTEFFD
jgi:phospholipid/cholesterol/gamma-HCH transport system ATP-binding protein